LLSESKYANEKCLISSFIEYSKIVVGLGGTNNRTKNSNVIEIIDLESNTTICHAMENFPSNRTYSFGGLGYENEAIICAGFDAQNIYRDCYKYVNESWIFDNRIMPDYKEAGAFAFNPGVNFINFKCRHFSYERPFWQLFPRTCN